MPTTAGYLLREYPFLFPVAWGILGIWVGIGLVLTVVGVSLGGVLLGFGFGVVVAVVENKATQQAIA